MFEPGEQFRRLSWTVAGLVAALVPHMTHLRIWVTGFVLALCAWRLLAERRGWRLPRAAPRLLIGLIATAGVIASYSTITGLDGGTALLVLMAALKLLETRTPRDHVVLIFIGWFLCLSAFLYSQDILTVAWVVPTVWLLAAALLEVARRAQGPAPAPFRTTGAMLLKALPLALVLFVFFPRIAGSFWGAPSHERALTGLTEEMSPGDISDLTLNDTVAFRVRFQGAPPPPSDRYWRGPVLNEFDGYTWSRGDNQFYFRPPVRYRGQAVDYTVTLEPTGQRMLFALDMVEQWPPAMAEQSWDYQLHTRNPVNSVLQYPARSYPRYEAGAQLSPALRNLHLQLPPSRNPRTIQLARSMRAAAAGDREFTRSVLAMFRDQEFYYTLTPPGLDRDSVDDFLFNTRRGFCGHYASAFTMMMRAAGIPARVVAGYQGGDWNPIGRYLILRQSHAHAWSEVWLPDSGWTRIDPTAAVAPERIERGLEGALSGDELLQGGLGRNFGLLWQAGMIWDNVNARWNDWVVQFNRLRQEELLRAFGFDDPDWQDLALVLGVGLAVTLAMLSGWLAWEFRPRRLDPAAANYRRFVQRLARRGVERAPYEAPRDFAARVRHLRPDLGPAASAITEMYLRLRYMPAHTARDLTLLRGLVRRFDP
jgi:transglutaminase-like putative cysteine protease